MIVKICGTTNLEDAQLSAELGAGALGFIFAPSKRQVTAEQAAAITRELPASIEKVGVFTEPNVEKIVRTVQQAGLTAVQLHTPYDPTLVDGLWVAMGLDVRLWQVVGLDVAVAPEEVAMEQWRTATRRPLADPRLAAVLLDTVKDGRSGGLGAPFPWALAARALDGQRATIDAAGRRTGLKLPALAVAGGLRPETVREAIKTLRPWGVDVVSGVEESPGRKSPAKLRDFLLAAHAAG